MSTYDVPVGTIVVGVDGSRQAEQALEWAVDQASAERRALTLAHAIPPLQGVWLDPAGVDHRIGLGGVQAEAEHLLEQARDLVSRRAPGLEVHEVLRVADPRQLLLDLGAEATMVVLGSRGRGPVRSLLLGSVGVALTRHAPCPVVVHRPWQRGRVRHGVLVGVDATERSLPVLEFGYRVAAQRDLPLQVVLCHWDRPVDPTGSVVLATPLPSLEEERLALAEAVAGLSEKFPEVRARVEVARGMARVVLAARSERMDLVVLGAHHGGLPTELLFGSVTTDVVEHAACPVAVVPVTRG